MEVRNIKILAVDQSTKITGYSVFNGKDLITLGKLEVSDKFHYIERIKIMCYKIEQKIILHEPEIVLLEDTHYSNNQNTLKQLAQLQGSLMNILHERDLPFVIIEPTKWKAGLSIKGRKRIEQKKNTQIFVKEKFQIDASEDEADAVCIGYFYVQKGGNI